MSIDTYQEVRKLVRDHSLTTKEIAQRTGYSVGYVSELRRRAPSEDFKHRRIRLAWHAEEMLAALTELLNDPYLGDPVNNDRMARARAVVAKIKETV